MDFGLVGAGILSGALGAHIVALLRERASRGAWTDSLLGMAGGGLCAQFVIMTTSGWVETTVGYAIGRIAAAVVAGLLGGALLLLVAGLFRSTRAIRNDEDAPQPEHSERRFATSDRRKGERRLSETDA